MPARHFVLGLVDDRIFLHTKSHQEKPSVFLARYDLAPEFYRLRFWDMPLADELFALEREYDYYRHNMYPSKRIPPSLIGYWLVDRAVRGDPNPLVNRKEALKNLGMICR